LFDFYLNTKIKFGCGVRRFIPEILLKENWSRVGLVVDHNLVKFPIVEEVIGQLQKLTDLFILANCSISEPTYDSLEEMRKEFCEASLQVIIGLGGGSAIDMAKAMAVLVHNKKPAIEYRGFNKMTEPVLPIITVPTTAGTGSEVTPNASFIDTHEKKKMGINGEIVRPCYTLLDPELTLSCPKSPTISAAVDSIVHAVEAFVAKKSNPLAKFFAKEGFQKVIHALPQIIDDLENIDLRQEVMYGAFLSGIALMHSGTGPAAAMSYPLGVHYHVPHGIGGGIFLPYVVQHNVRQGITDYSDLYQVMGRVGMALSRGELSEKFATNLFKTLRQVGVPDDINKFGIKLEAINTFISETMELKGALDQNPVPFYEKEIENTLRILIGESHD